MRFSRLPIAAGVFVTCGLAAAAPISAAPATAWNLELARGRTASTTVTVVNRCRAAHTFEVTGDPKAPWLSFPGPTTVSPPAGGGLTVNARVDARALDPGHHHAAITARCLDCGSEPLCTQDRDVFDARLKVLWPEEDLRSFEPSEIFPGEILAVLEAGADRLKIEKQFSLRSEGSFELPTIGATIVRFRTAGPERPLVAALGALQKDPGVRLAQPNFLYRVEQRSTNDPFRDRQYALDTLGVSRVHDNTTGRGVTVAVLDSFVNPKHPDLPGALAESADFFSKAPPVLAEGHGVAMTGIIAARANNGVGIAGVAPDTTVLSVRVCGSPSERAHEICSSDAIARGLDLAVARKARVVSMSLAGSYDPLVARLVYRAAEGGIVLVAATGNDGLATVKYPAAYEPVLAVTAIDRQDRLYEKANRGARVDLAAPGVDVFSLASPQLFGPTTGTSPAAAQVSGVVALLLQLRPDFSPAQVRQLLEETARDLGPPGRDEQFGSGAVDACRAVAKLTGVPTPCR